MIQVQDMEEGSSSEEDDGPPGERKLPSAPPPPPPPKDTMQPPPLPPMPDRVLVKKGYDPKQGMGQQICLLSCWSDFSLQFGIFSVFFLIFCC